MKAISCDSSSIIALSSNCLMGLIEKFDAEFWIPPYVRKEIIDYPITTKKYGFEAMRNGLYIGKSLKVVGTDTKLRDRIIELSNKLLKSENRFLKIVHYGEADALALAVEKGLKTLLVDEKNTRLVIEDVETLRAVMERRLNKKIEINDEARAELRKLLSGIKVIRSTELVTVAVKRGLLDWPYSKRELLRNTLYALKFSGCAISEGEIIELMNSL